ncbi:hypothetical protein NP233_g3804 [Leucocoprinus birnbaumii]|uniref:Transmembrane protein n=1 Tax=Leucocoprinus birnbaumii TaxID=56174 RepID=A0AAD5YXQ4_9AGAR|nr:hypothetical protein NP233_g3804 [Leucocoprinus birnbaumii]
MKMPTRTGHTYPPPPNKAARLPLLPRAPSNIHCQRPQSSMSNVVNDIYTSPDAVPDTSLSNKQMTIRTLSPLRESHVVCSPSKELNEGSLREDPNGDGGNPLTTISDTSKPVKNSTYTDDEIKATNGASSVNNLYNDLARMEGSQHVYDVSNSPTSYHEETASTIVPPLTKPEEGDEDDGFVTAEEGDCASKWSPCASFTSDVTDDGLSTIYEEDANELGDIASFNALHLAEGSTHKELSFTLNELNFRAASEINQESSDHQSYLRPSHCSSVVIIFIGGVLIFIAGYATAYGFPPQFGANIVTYVQADRSLMNLDVAGILVQQVWSSEAEPLRSSLEIGARRIPLRVSRQRTRDSVETNPSDRFSMSKHLCLFLLHDATCSEAFCVLDANGDLMSQATPGFENSWVVPSREAHVCSIFCVALTHPDIETEVLFALRTINTHFSTHLRTIHARPPIIRPPVREVVLPLLAHKNVKLSSVDQVLLAQLSTGLAYCWPEVRKVYSNADENLKIRLINPHHISSAFNDPHWTFKWIDKKNMIVGTMHVPGARGAAVDTWTSVGKKWVNVNVELEFVPCGKVSFEVPEADQDDEDI